MSRQSIFEVFPQPLHRVNFWGIRRGENKAHMWRQLHLLRDVRRSIIEHQEIEPISISLCEVVKENLKQAPVESWQFEKKAFASQWLDAAVELKTLQFVLVGCQRFDAAQGQAAAQDGDEAEATFILCPNADRLLRPRQLVEGGDRHQLHLPADRLSCEDGLAQAVFERLAEACFIGLFFLDVCAVPRRGVRRVRAWRCSG